MPESEQHEKKVERELEQIKRNTNISPVRIILEGILRGAGFLIGTVVAVALLSWALSAFGVIPGLGEIFLRLRSILEARAGLP